MSDLTIDQNDDEALDIQVNDREGAPADLSNCSLKWAVRPSKASTVLVLEKSSPNDGLDIALDQVGADKGKATITIASADTAAVAAKYLDRDLVWELDAVDSVSNEVTLARGSIVIRRDLVP